MTLKDDFVTDDYYTAPAADAVAATVNALESAVAQAGQVVPHGNNADYPRPELAVVVMWVGSVQPNNAVEGDVWMDTAGTAPAITTTTLGSLNLNAPTSQMLVASGTLPLIWSVQAGSLPAGLTLSDAGELWGTPSAEGSFDFTVQVLNGFGSVTQEYTGTVGAETPPSIWTTTIAPVVAGVPMSVTLARSGSVPILFNVQSGTLPTGLSLNGSTGVISGTTNTLGSYSFTVRASNTGGYDDQVFSGSVTGQSAAITTTTLDKIWRGFAFSQTLAVTGTPPVTFAIQSGSLPTGLSLNTSTGAITGTVSTLGSYSVTIRATNTYGHNDRTLAGSITESTPQIQQTTLTAMKQSVAFDQTLTLANGGPTITWSVQSGSLPTGLSLNASTGEISGTPTAAGTYGVTIRASNGTDFDDQVFTGSVTSLAVAFTAASAFATSGAANVTSKTLTGPTATAGDTVILWVDVVTSVTVTATYGGTSMTAVGSPYLWYTGNGGLYLRAFYIQNVPAGAASIVVSVSSAVPIHAGAVSYSGVGTVGSSLIGSNSNIGTAASVTCTSATGHMLSQAFGCGQSLSTYSQTARVGPTTAQVLGTFNPLNMLIGDAPGAASVSFTATCPATGWGGAAVDLSPSS